MDALPNIHVYTVYIVRRLELKEVFPFLAGMIDLLVNSCVHFQLTRAGCEAAYKTLAPNLNKESDESRLSHTK